MDEFCAKMVSNIFLFYSDFLKIYFWLCWAFTAAWAFLQLWRVGATLCLWCMAFHHGGFSCFRARALGHISVVVAPGLQSTGSIVVAHWLSYSAACGVFPDQGWNPCPLHWQVDSLPLSHRGSSTAATFNQRFPCECIL